jgi:hypothetical protein
MDDYQPGVGLFSVTFEKPPLLKPSDVARELGRYKLDRLRAKITAAVELKDGVLWAGGYRLSKEDVAVKPASTYLLTGVVSEDERGVLTLTLTKAEPKE